MQPEWASSRSLTCSKESIKESAGSFRDRTLGLRHIDAALLRQPWHCVAVFKWWMALRNTQSVNSCIPKVTEQAAIDEGAFPGPECVGFQLGHFGRPSLWPSDRQTCQSVLPITFPLAVEKTGSPLENLLISYHDNSRQGEPRVWYLILNFPPIYLRCNGNLWLSRMFAHSQKMKDFASTNFAFEPWRHKSNNTHISIEKQIIPCCQVDEVAQNCFQLMPLKCHLIPGNFKKITVDLWESKRWIWHFNQKCAFHQLKLILVVHWWTTDNRKPCFTRLSIRLFIRNLFYFKLGFRLWFDISGF